MAQLVKFEPRGETQMVPRAQQKLRGSAIFKEPMERIFLPETAQDRAFVFEEAGKCVDCIYKWYPELHKSIGTALRQVVQVAKQAGDLNYCQAIFLFCIPQFETMTDELMENVDPVRKSRYIHELVYRRKNFLDGLTCTQEDCKLATDVQFPNLREFVRHMRTFYLLRITNHDRYEKKRLQSQWDSEQADPSADIGTLYFSMVGLIMYSTLLVDNSSYQPYNRPPLQTVYFGPSLKVERKKIPGPIAPISNEERDLLRGLNQPNLEFYAWHHHWG